MKLYNFTLQKSAAVHLAVVGNFLGGKQQEILCCSGTFISLYKVEADSGKVCKLFSQDVFGLIRSCVPFRLTGGSKDYVVLGTDSGRLVILEYHNTHKIFTKVHMETFGKSGCRRIVPGEYLVVEPKGRALMISAVEKQKLVYVLNRDSEAKLTISSPLEAHKNRSVVFHSVGVDVGFENPVFATIELDYEDVDESSEGESLDPKPTVTFYELDLGLNHVVRKQSTPLKDFANLLLPVPGGSDGPGGLLVCMQGVIMYLSYGLDMEPIYCNIPTREGVSGKGGSCDASLIVCGTMHRTKNFFFFLLQNEYGDVFRVSLNVEDEIVKSIRLKYFDTVPVANSLCILKSGFLFLPSEFGNHHLYQIVGLGDETPDEEFSSDHYKNGVGFQFSPQPLRNLLLVDEIESLSPIVDCKALDISGSGDVSFYAACGRGPKSTFRALTHGLSVTEYMSAPGLPGNPKAVWALKRSLGDVFHQYIVLSFLNATLVLCVGDTVEEVSDTGILLSTPSLFVGNLDHDTMIQITSTSIRHIKSDARVNEWKLPGTQTIVTGDANERQVVVSLNTNEIVYFELDDFGQLNEYTERKEMASNIACVSIGPIPDGKQKSRYLAVGLLDNTVRILSLDSNDCLEPLSMQAVPSQPSSLYVIDMHSGVGDVGASLSLYLYVGLQNGVMLKSVVDPVTGSLSDTRTRYLGARPVILSKHRVKNQNAIFAVSTKSWLSYFDQTVNHFTPLCYEELYRAVFFSFEQCPEALVAISGNTLRVIALENLGQIFNHAKVSLLYTPRRLQFHRSSKCMFVIESDHNVSRDVFFPSGENSASLDPVQFGVPFTGNKKWASCVRLIDLQNIEALDLFHFQPNEAAFCMTSCKLSASDDTEYVVVGTAFDVCLHPRSTSGGCLHVFRVVGDASGRKLEHVHDTLLDGIPTAVHPFQNRLLVGVGKLLRIYDLGKKKMLRKCEMRNLPNCVVSICTMGNRIVVGDLQESIHFILYRSTDNRLVIFADDISPRWITCMTPLDFNTVACGDKFGNISILRLSAETQDEMAEDPSGYKFTHEKGATVAASHKVVFVAGSFVGEVVTSIQRARLFPGAGEAIVYSTLGGTIGVLAPFMSQDDCDFFSHLEMNLGNRYPPICGRDHIAFRSYYFPVKNVIDGDLCEQFNILDSVLKRTISEDLDRPSCDISRKLEDIRSFYAF